MIIKEFVPVKRAPDRPADGVEYLENTNGVSCTVKGDFIADKIARLKNYDFDYAVFRHDDTVIHTPGQVPVNCERMRMDGVGVAGVIGTLIMGESCGWWMHKRGVMTAGSILQGDGRGGAYPMADRPGYRTDMVSVDGCFMIFSKKFIELYEPHLFGHWRFGYDTDACFQCLQNGMNVGIVDVTVRHESQGSFNPDEWEKFRKSFLDYWRRYVDFPVIKQSTFKQQEETNESRP